MKLLKDWQNKNTDVGALTVRGTVKEIHFLAEMRYAEPYPCKLTTAFGGLANSIQKRLRF